MIESIMFFAIGFLIASLIGLVIIPLVHARAVRLTMRRLEASIPVSMAEIQADKDQLRAEFAMSTRRLEMSVEQMKAKTTAQLAELGKKTEAVNRLKLELGEKTATIFALEAREKALRDQLRATEEEFALKTNTLHEAERTLADKQAEFVKVASTLDERSLTADSQKVEIVALRTQVQALTEQIGATERQVKDSQGRVKETEERLGRERNDAAMAAKELADARGKVENLGNRIAELDRQIAVQRTEAESFARRIQELEARLAEQAGLIAERMEEADRLREQIESGQAREAGLRAQLAEAQGRLGATGENHRAERALVEAQLEQVRAERDRLQGEIATMKREAEAGWAAERVETALLRERINDVAAEVARMTIALEGPGSPIEAILAEKAPGPNGASAINGTAPTSNAPASGGNLADRIRALQSRASRLSNAS